MLERSLSLQWRQEASQNQAHLQRGSERLYVLYDISNCVNYVINSDLMSVLMKVIVLPRKSRSLGKIPCGLWLPQVAKIGKCKHE